MSAATGRQIINFARLNLRRFNPFKASVEPPTAEPFDPRKQSWAAGTLAAIEAFLGAIMALPLVVWVAFFVGSLLTGSYKLHSYSRLRSSGGAGLWTLGAWTLVSAALLWAGLALMFGWRSRYRAHGVLALLALVLIVTRYVLMTLWALA